jgi:hypothetical protein
MSNSKRNILILWIQANIFGFVLAIIIAGLGIGLSWSFYYSNRAYSSAIYYIVSVLVVSIIPFAQWLTLRRFFTGLRWWIPASLGGTIIGWIFLTYIPENGLVPTIFATLPIGCMQYLCIHQSFEKKIWWVLASTLGLSSIFIIGHYSFYIGSIGAAIYVMLTGICLTRWERQTIEKNRG